MHPSVRCAGKAKRNADPERKQAVCCWQISRASRNVSRGGQSVISSVSSLVAERKTHVPKQREFGPSACYTIEARKPAVQKRGRGEKDECESQKAGPMKRSDERSRDSPLTSGSLFPLQAFSASASASDGAFLAFPLYTKTRARRWRNGAC